MSGGKEELSNRVSPTPDASADRVFRYTLVDLGGREVDVVERHAPLRRDEMIIASSSEAWRVVAVLGTSATVARM